MGSRLGAKFGALLWGVALWPCAAVAGAWPQPVNETLLIVPFTVSWATKNYDAAGDQQRRNRFSKVELQPYFEYGLWSDLTLVGTVALSRERSSWLGSTISQRGLSRAEFGARYALGEWQDTYFSVQPIIIWHGAMSSDDSYASKRGDVDGEFGITMGQHFKWLGLDGFSDNLIAFRVKPASRPNEIKANLTLGISFNHDIQIMLKSESLSTISQDQNAAVQQVMSNKLGLSFVKKIDKMVTTELSYMQSLSGKNTVKESSLGFALWYHF
ncbi:MAG: hypothetical protein ACOH12_13265 [Parvibaculaceae bacterium]